MAGAGYFSTDRFAFKLGAFYAAYFFFGGVQLPFFPLWLEARGLDARTIGLLIAVPMVVRIVATPIIAHQADRRRALKSTLAASSVASTLGMAAVGLAETPATIFAAFLLSAIAFSPVLSLTDAYALSGLAPRGRAYGPVRLWGSVAFIAGNVGAGAMLHVLSAENLIWLIVASLLVSAVVAATLTPLENAGGDAPPAAQPSPKRLLGNTAFLAVALASAMVQSSHALYYGFSTMQWRAEGLDGSIIGVLWGVGVAAEVALFACSARLPPTLRPETLLVLGSLGAILRWTAMAFDPGAALLPALQVLHAGSFAATHLGLMGFMARSVPRELAGTAQGLVATFSGLVNASATFASGYAYAAAGSRAYLMMSAMALVGLAAATMAARRAAR